MSRKRAQSRPPASPSSADEDSDRVVGGGAADDDIPDGFREMVDCLVAVKLRTLDYHTHHDRSYFTALAYTVLWLFAPPGRGRMGRPMVSHLVTV